MKPLHAFTRGGQLAVHQFRMLKQICVVTVLLSTLSGLLTFPVLLWRGTHPQTRETVWTYAISHIQWDLWSDSKSKAFLQNPRARFHMYVFEKALRKTCLSSLYVLVLTVLGVTLFFAVRGVQTSRKSHGRGAQMVSPKTLKRLLRREGLASDLTLDDVPLLKDKETGHMLITGTTGSGKTNCLHTLLPQIRAQRNRAIIVDLTGDFVSNYFREGHDLLLNPLDQRSKLWSPWADCKAESHFDTLAAAILPSSQASEPFWENAGKALLSSALKELAARGERDVSKLYHLLVRSDLKAFSAFFRGTEAAPYTHMEGEKMTLSIRATLANHLQSFRYLSGTEEHPEENRREGFSIRDWVSHTGNDQWLFLSAKPDTRETLRPLIRGWLEIASNALMSLPPDPNRRLWFILDELPALQRLPSLETSLAESRKYGGCFLAGIQSISQMTSAYGQSSASAILDLFNTKIFFRNTDPTTTAWISKVLGEAETTERIENLSYGAHLMRDGVSLSPQMRTKPLVLPSEVANLKDGEALLKLPGPYPATRLLMTLKRVERKGPGFVERDHPETKSGS